MYGVIFKKTDQKFDGLRAVQTLNSASLDSTGTRGQTDHMAPPWHGLCKMIPMGLNRYATKFMSLGFLIQGISMLAIFAHALSSQEILKCDVYSLGTSLDKDDTAEVHVRTLSAQTPVQDGQAKLNGASLDVRPLLDGVPQKLFSPNPIPSPIEYAAKLEKGKIFIEASAAVASGGKETFSLTAFDTPEREGEFPGATLKARLKSTLEPEVRFDDNISRGFEVQCLHMNHRE